MEAMTFRGLWDEGRLDSANIYYYVENMCNVSLICTDIRKRKVSHLETSKIKIQRTSCFIRNHNYGKLLSHDGE